MVTEQMRAPFEKPSWAELRSMASDHAPGLTEVGRRAVLNAYGWLEDALGPDWITRLWDAEHRVFGDLLMASTHVAGLSRLLRGTSRLQRYAAVPSFSRAVKSLAAGPSYSQWCHTLLQTEVAAVAEEAGNGVSFERPVAGGAGRTDVFVTSPDRPSFGVEVFTRFRPDRSIAEEHRVDRLFDQLRQIEDLYQVVITAELTSGLISQGAESWITELQRAAREVHRLRKPITVHAETGAATLAPRSASTTGQYSVSLDALDFGRRLQSGLWKKAQQAAGDLPTWLRTDVVDGLWQLTPWAAQPLDVKLQQLREALASDLRHHPHILGLAMSCGVVLDPDRRPAEIHTTQWGGVAARIPLELSQCREILIVPFTPAGAESAAESLTQGYMRELEWSQRDLQSLGVPSLTECWQ